MENFIIAENFKKNVVDLIKTATGAPPSPARKKLSLEEIADEFSPEIDEKILLHEYAGEKFSFGKFRIVALKNLAFVVSYELYFRNAAGKYNMVAIDVAPRNSWVWLSNDAWLELKTVHEKIFDIEAPIESG